jgi:hypothetical protein
MERVEVSPSGSEVLRGEMVSEWTGEEGKTESGMMWVGLGFLCMGGVPEWSLGVSPRGKEVDPEVRIEELSKRSFSQDESEKKRVGKWF